MKTIQAILLAIFTAAVFSSCHTTNYSDKTYKFADPEYARTTTDLQDSHGEMLRQYY